MPAGKPAYPTRGGRGETAAYILLVHLAMPGAAGLGVGASFAMLAIFAQALEFDSILSVAVTALMRGVLRVAFDIIDCPNIELVAVVIWPGGRADIHALAIPATGGA